MTTKPMIVHKWLYAIPILGTFLLVYLLLCERNDGNDAVQFASVVLLAAIIFSIAYLPKVKIVKNYKICIESLALALLFLIQMSLTEFLRSGCLKHLNVPIQIFAVTVLFLNIALVMYLAFNEYLKIDFDKSNKMTKNCYFVCMTIIIAESLLFILSTYPGIWLRDDVAGVYNSGRSDWHTLGYVLFVKICSTLYKSQYSVVVIQTIVWIVLNLYIIDFLGKFNSKVVKIYMIMLCAFFLPFLYLELMVKDTVFSMGVMALTAVTFKLLIFKNIDWKDIAILTTIPLFTLLCRHGGVIVVLVTILSILLWARLKKLKNFRSLKLVLLWYILVFMFVNVLLMNGLNVEKNPKYVKYGIPMAEVGAAVQNNVEFDDNDIKVLEQVMPLEDWGSCYDEYWVDTIARSWGRIGDRIYIVQKLVDEQGFGKDLLRINMKLLIRHPGIYLKALFDMNSIVWEMAKPADANIYTVCEVPEDPQIRYSVSYSITNKLAVFLDQYPVSRAVLTRGGFALFMILFSCTAFIHKKKYCMLIGVVPIITVVLMLMISVPAQDPRYILPIIESCIVIFTIASICDNCQLSEKMALNGVTTK